MQRSAEMRAALASPGAAAPAKAEWKSAEEAMQLQQSRTGQDGVCVFKSRALNGVERVSMRARQGQYMGYEVK